MRDSKKGCISKPKNNQKSSKANCRVGPGRYTLPENDLIKHCNPKWTIRTRKNNDDKMEAYYPGPTNYNTLTQSKAPLLTMGSKYRIPSGKSNMFDISPATYNTQSHFYDSKGVSFTRSKQRPDLRADCFKTPGPTNYSSVSIHKNLKGGSFTRTRKFVGNQSMENCPGPGSYDSKSCFQPKSKTKASKTVRGRYSGKSDYRTPGPGRYSLASSTLRLDKNFTMKKKYDSKFNQTLPGPADYNNLSQKSICGGTIGRTKKKWRELKNMEPSPDSYSPDYNSVKKRKPHFAFPSSGRKAIRLEEYPGPAEPSVKESMSVKGTRTLLSKGTSNMISKTNKSTLNIVEGPGPNKYNASEKCILPGKPSFTIMKASKHSYSKETIPGPGSYSTPQEAKVQNIIFTKEDRHVTKLKLQETPGPGSYNLAPSVPAYKKVKHSKVLKRLRKLFQSQMRKRKKDISFHKV
ncbi:unnamed protein product [Moneuplotes crassus]|uniref:Uncharacterized protein n=1 Tax=Euplotes crassus TaxID=5936 RepID=A0AAD1UA18_EUPCR|nr:unnamed protein product [Moneuplotes crassus]